jgi:hypothetical protein
MLSLVACGDNDIEITIDDDDNNDSFDEAEELPVDEATGIRGRIGKPSDRDFFRFEADPGLFYRIETIANRTDAPDLIDTVVRIYGADEIRIAQSDDAIPRLGRDSLVVVRSTVGSTIFVEVMDWFDWTGADPRGDTSFIYDLRAITMSDELPGVLIDSEPGDDAASATPVDIDLGFGQVLGDLDRMEDVDVFRIDVGDEMRPFYDSSFAAPGANGNGSTATIGSVTLTDASGTSVLARIDGAQRLSPPLSQNQSYLIFVAHDTGTPPGTNAFYSHTLAIRSDNVSELESAPGENDTLATAEPLASQAGRFFVVAALTSTDDIDYFRFTASEGDGIGLNCVGQRAGSGVRGLTVEIRDRDDVALYSELEPTDRDLDVSGIAATYSGDYFLTLRKSAQDAEVTSDFVRCGVRFNE